MKLINNIGFILLAVFLILTGITGLIPVAIPGIVLNLLALLSGIFILIGR